MKTKTNLLTMFFMILAVTFLSACSLIPPQNAIDVLNRTRSSVDKLESIAADFVVDGSLKTDVIVTTLDTSIKANGQSKIILDKLLSETYFTLDNYFYDRQVISDVAGTIYTQLIPDVENQVEIYNNFGWLGNTWKKQVQNLETDNTKVNLGFLKLIWDNQEALSMAKEKVTIEDNEYYQVDGQMPASVLLELLKSLGINLPDSATIPESTKVDLQFLINAKDFNPYQMTLKLPETEINEYPGRINLDVMIKARDYDAVAPFTIPTEVIEQAQ